MRVCKGPSQRREILEVEEKEVRCITMERVYGVCLSMVPEE